VADCKRIKRKNRKVCIGDLSEEITIKGRTIQASLPGAQKFTEAFAEGTTVWAAVETNRGDQFFDGTSLRTAATHIFYIRYLAGVTQESYIEFNEILYDILDVEDLDERGQFMKIPARKRGHKDVKVNEG
jgi:SPP1 family predicted phage head-tail adaptor